VTISLAQFGSALNIENTEEQAVSDASPISTSTTQSKVIAQATRLDPLLPWTTPPTFEDLSEDYPDDKIPYLDRIDVDESKLSKEQRFWRDNGYVILPGLIPDDLVDAYLDLRRRNNVSLRAWQTPVPYMYFEELKNICCYKPLSDMLKKLIGAEMGMHFNITQMFSTERGWHQDDCLNPPDIYSWYAAIWIALDDIHPDCGPFELVPGSHKWACMKSDKIKQHLKPEFRNAHSSREETVHWAALAELMTTGAYENKLQRSGLKTEKFLGKKGDVLIWHGRLLHRGSVPKNENIPRPAIITHYSDIATRRDIGDRIRQHKDGGWYWDFPSMYLTDSADIPNMERLVSELAQKSDRVDELERELAKRT
jgi:Phytanoyl-CoA dioxygenase (PhyH)